MSDAFQVDPQEPVEVKFENLVGEGKKYRDQDAVAKAVVEKDQFIERLKQETAEMREALAKREKEASFIDRLDELTKAKLLERQDPPAHDRADTDATAVPPVEQIEKVIEAREAKKARDSNLAQTVNRLQELYGDDYKRHVSKQAQAMGMSTQELTDLAARSPAAFFRTLGVDVPRQDAFNPPPKSTLSAPSTQSGMKNYSYYQKMRAEKGEAHYFTPSVQNEMWNSLKQLGEAEFYKR